MKDPGRKILVLMAVLLSALVTLASLVALGTENFYASETANWKVQSMGQDLVNLYLVVPCLLVSAILLWRGSQKAAPVLCSILLYVTYTFTIYCFDIHFNRLFVIYFVCFGLSIYAVLYYFFVKLSYSNPVGLVNKAVLKTIAAYFIFIAVFFYFLWMSEIIPAIFENSAPDSVLKAGLFTNGIHVIDLSFFLPLVFITGILLLRKRKIALMFTPVLLSFFILMDITVGFLAFLMRMRNIEGNLSVIVFMACLTIVSTLLLILFFKTQSRE